MRTSGALVALVALACVAAVSANTAGTTLRGYTFSTDVSDYLGISQDICDIRKMLNVQQPPYNLTLAIYMNGKNAKRADGSILSMRELATAAPQDSKFWKTYATYFNNPTWLDDIIQRAFGGLAPYKAPVARVQLAVKGMESNLQMATVMRLLDEAVSKTKAGKANEATRALDAAWAVFVGGNPDCGLWTVSMKRANEFGTKLDCETSIVASNIRKAFLDAQKAIKAGDAAAVEKARNAVQTQLFALYVQATITYAHEMYLDKLADIPPAEHQVEAYAFFRTIAPLVNEGKKEASQALDFWLFPGQPTIKEVDLAVVRALGSAYDANGITPKDIGQYGRKQPELGCKAYVAKATAGGILSTTNAKDSLRPGGADAGAAAPDAAAPDAAAAAPKAAPKAPAAAAKP